MAKTRIAVMLALCTMAGSVLAAKPVTHEVASDAYLKPQVHVGEQLLDVYSKSMSWSGPGLKSFVSRYSGTSAYTITAVTPEAIVFDETDRTDGQPPDKPVPDVKVLADGNTFCYKGHCQVNDQTSGVFLIPLLWGHAPEHLHAGSHWSVTVDKPWEIGPKGVEEVRVVSTDPANGEITLVRHGSGEGPSSDLSRWMSSKQPIAITTADGKKVAVKMLPGKATWDGYTTVRHGVIVGDEIMLTQQVKFVAKDGKVWSAEWRVYTLLNLGSHKA